LADEGRPGHQVLIEHLTKDVGRVGQRREDGRMAIRGNQRQLTILIEHLTKDVGHQPTAIIGLCRRLCSRPGRLGGSGSGGDPGVDTGLARRHHRRQGRQRRGKGGAGAGGRWDSRAHEGEGFPDAQMKIDLLDWSEPEQVLKDEVAEGAMRLAGEQLA